MKSYYNQITEEVRKIARNLLEEGKVKKIIGYGKAEYSDETTPIFITRSEEAEKLIFNADSYMMLAKYLLNYPETRIGIVAKPCDTRAINTYLSEGLINRDNLVVIGINGCRGIEGNSACNECRIRNPVLSDFSVGKSTDEKEITLLLANEESELEKLSSKERLTYFQNEFSRCTRCYACRQACYVCYCEECFVDSNQPRWVGESVKLPDNFTYHLMRAMHMAGRCINCGACEMACPESIDVRALTAKMYRTGKEIFNYEPGIDPEQKTLLSDYDINDSQPGFIE